MARAYYKLYFDDQGHLLHTGEMEETGMNDEQRELESMRIGPQLEKSGLEATQTYASDPLVQFVANILPVRLASTMMGSTISVQVLI